MSENNLKKQEQIQNQPMKCSVQCMYFPDMTCNSWKYDEKDPNIKRRDDGKQFVCAYDGHVIKSWYDTCPKEEDSKKEKEM